MKKVIIVSIIFLLTVSSVKTVFADSVTDNAFTFLKGKQDITGRITTGFSAPSDWSAIAFSANGTDISSVKSGEKSLLDFMLTDVPTGPSSATDWESRLLAIIAAGYDPTNFGGTNYVSHLESFYTAGQLGDTCSLNDDIFGLMAEIAAGDEASIQVKQNTLNFLLSQQDPTDGGYSYSAQGCSFYGTSADITGAAAVALTVAKNNGVTAPNLDAAIASVSAYLTTNQDSDGGYGYFGSSDTDSTGWVLQGLNALGLGLSTQAVAARNYLLSQQGSDGGIQAFDYGSNTFVSNATTTSQALIGLLGKTWVLRIYDADSVTQTVAITVTPTPTSEPTPTPTNTSTSTSVVVASNPTPTDTQHASVVYTADTTNHIDSASVLGTTSEKKQKVTYTAGTKTITLPFILIVCGCLFLLAGAGKIGYNYFYKKN